MSSLRVLHLASPAMRGTDVRDVQLELANCGFKPGAIDSVYGPATYAAVVAFQKATHLASVDGIVGPVTRYALLHKKPAPSKASLPPIRFVQARHYTPGPRGKGAIRLLVIHDMEAPEGPLTAENVANWFAGPTAPQASAHYCVDNNSIVQCVHDADIAWHAPGANHDGIGLEHAGYARQTPAEWADPYSKAMLELSARLAADLCRKYGIPAVHLTPAQLKSGKAGIVGHWDVTKAWPDKGSHTDPGASYPWESYVRRVKAILVSSSGSRGA